MSLQTLTDHQTAALMCMADFIQEDIDNTPSLFNSWTQRRFCENSSVFSHFAQHRITVAAVLNALEQRGWLVRQMTMPGNVWWVLSPLAIDMLFDTGSA